MRFLASIPELCDVTFLVGETREPVCAVKAVLAARSRWVDHGWSLAFCPYDSSLSRFSPQTRGGLHTPWPKRVFTEWAFYFFFLFRVFKKMLFDSRIKPREPPQKESKLRAFIKRSSEPLLGMQITQQVQETLILALPTWKSERLIHCTCCLVSCVSSFISCRNIQRFQEIV